MSDSVSLCVLRIEVDEDFPEMGDNPVENEAAKEQKKKDRGARESSTITVETYASIVSGPNTDPGILPTSSRRTTPEDSVDEGDTIAFFCGNPLIEVTKGVLHLYKENELKEAEAKTLCLLSVPGALGAPDLLAFAAACQQDIAHVRVLRDGSIDHYMALLTFRSHMAAREFHAAFDGVPYSLLEPLALCRMAWVSRVEWARDGAAPQAHTELPICPVCLERMDESVAGVLSVQCAHAFHAECLVRWRGAACPVCRAAQVPEPSARPHCQACRDNAETSPSAEEETDTSVTSVCDGDTVGSLRGPEGETGEGLLESPPAAGPSLWICLICGHVGCGRYEGGHAAKHFLASNHTYALQLGSNRVWDYAGDNFVHRLVQNKADGKLVSAGPGSEDSQSADKEQQLQFTYILTHQLDEQRAFYDDKIDKLVTEHSAECEALRVRASESEAAATALSEQVTSLQRDNKALERKLHTLTAKMSTLQGQLNEERGLGSALATSQAEWAAAAKLREDQLRAEISELKEQLRDVMFFVEARGQLERAQGATADEIQQASVSVPPPAKPRRKRR